MSWTSDHSLPHVIHKVWMIYLQNLNIITILPSHLEHLTGLRPAAAGVVQPEYQTLSGSSYIRLCFGGSVKLREWQEYWQICALIIGTSISVTNKPDWILLSLGMGSRLQKSRFLDSESECSRVGVNSSTEIDSRCRLNRWCLHWFSNLCLEIECSISAKSERN